MVVCRYYLDNKCRFGDNCKFEHPRGDVQRNLFGQDNNWNSSNNNNNKYKWTSNVGNSGGTSSTTASAHQQNTVSALDIVNNLPREIELWERSKMWPFSCISMERDIESLPGLYDMSTEEMRWEAYQGLKSGNIQPYVDKVQSLTAEFQNKRQHLKNLTPDVRQKLVALLEELRKKKMAGGPAAQQTASASSSSSSFGQPQPQTPSQGLFGKPAGGMATGNPFGGQANPLQSSTPAAGLFGKPAFSSTPGNPGPSGGSIFGNKADAAANSSTFGGFSAPAQSSGNPFAAAPQQTPAKSLFGGNSATPAANPFVTGNPASTAPQGLFGKPVAGQASSASVFGAPTPAQQQQQQQPSLFGNPAATTSLFGKPASSSTPQQTVFGAAAGSVVQPPVFGSAAASTPAQPSLFGNPPAAQQQQQPQTSLFGKPVPAGAAGGVGTQQTLFGKPVPGNAAPGLFSTGQSQGSPATPGNSAVASSSSSGAYTPLANLSEQEVAEFKAAAFTLGKIPLKPPARELINV